MNRHETQKTVALVTGANKGIGYEIARQLGEKGSVVFVGARDTARGAQAAGALRRTGIDARAVQLDVTDPRSIEAAGAAIDAAFGRLDILVNNAGILLDFGQVPTGLTSKALRDTYETNFFGPIAVIQALLPLLRKSPAGRIVNLSSSLGSIGVTTDPSSSLFDVHALAYNSSKTALNVATIAYAKELRDTPIKINAADPGYTQTDMNAGQGDHGADEGARAAVYLATLPPDGPSGTFVDKDGPVAW